MSVIPCQKNAKLLQTIEEYVEALKTEAHKLGSHGLPEDEFYRSVFRGAIERTRGQFSATMGPKREFARDVLNHLQDCKLIQTWESSGGKNRHDYVVVMPSGRVVAVELKGCLDGNNTTIFKRPANAQEFVIWSVCTNPSSDPRLNAWSGIHTRLGAEITHSQARVDGVIIWDMSCGTLARLCPKLEATPDRITEVGPFTLPPPCLYVLPGTVPMPRNNPHATAQSLDEVQFLKALHTGFQGQDDEVSYVDFSVRHEEADTERKTTIRRAGFIVAESEFTPLRRE